MLLSTRARSTAQGRLSLSGREVSPVAVGRCRVPARQRPLGRWAHTGARVQAQRAVPPVAVSLPMRQHWGGLVGSIACTCTEHQCSLCMAHHPIITGPVALAASRAHAPWAMIACLRELIVRSLPDDHRSDCLAASRVHEPWAMIACLCELIACSLPDERGPGLSARASQAIISMSHAR
jgi:hypothetical protein